MARDDTRSRAGAGRDAPGSPADPGAWRDARDGAPEGVTVWTADEALAMDRWLADACGLTVETLMRHAGARVAEAAREVMTARRLRRVVALVGPGNNGGDALVAERALREEVPTGIWRPLGEPTEPLLDAETLVIDGLFGVGLTRPLSGPARQAVERLNASPCTVLSVDVPSGLDATDGTVPGEAAGAGVAVEADYTLGLVGPKRGYFLARGPALVGRWRAASIGFPPERAEAWVAARRGAPPRSEGRRRGPPRS